MIQNDASCIHEYINYLSFPVKSHPWDYSVKICKINITASATGCAYDPKPEGKKLEDMENNFIDKILPKNKDIYTKDIAMTAPDTSGKDENFIFGNYSLLTIYVWSKE